MKLDKHHWYQTKTEKLSVDKIEDLTISTDGIFTFRNFDGKSYPKLEPSEIMTMFFEGRNELENSNKLKKPLIEN